MRRFVFLWFLLAMVLVSVLSALGVLWTGPAALFSTWGLYGSGLVHYGAETAALALATGGPAALERLERRIDPDATTRIYALDATGRDARALASPEAVRALAHKLNEPGSVEFEAEGGGLLAGSLVRGTDGQARRIVLWLPTRRVPGIPFNFWGWAWRLLTVAGIAVLFCTWLARRLSDPLARLRTAARRFATGDLAARAEPATFPANPPEYRELALDFDDMAGRIEALVTSQQQLLRDVSHELRTPLTRLNLAVNNARRSLAPDAAASLDRIDQESERLNSLIERILRLSRLESMRAAPSHDMIECSDFLESIVTDADFEAGARGRKVSLPQADLCRLRGDRELLREAIENVVRNAIRYTPEGGVVKIRGVRVDVVEYRIVVQDQGPGVPVEHLEAIFEPFYRAPQRGDGKGFGIGLAITKRAVGLHQGWITAQNRAGGGFELAVHLPVAEPEATALTFSCPAATNRDGTAAARPAH